MNSVKDWIIKHHTVVTLSSVLSILLGLFSAIIEELYEKNSAVVEMDLNIAQEIIVIRNPFLNQIFLTITQLGNTITLIISFTLALLLFICLKKYNQLITIVLTFLGSLVITFTIKEIVQRARPLDGLIVEHGFNFPSGHAFVGVCFWGVLFYLLSTLIKNKALKMLLIICGIILALLIGFSRVYIGVHWPSDVVASYLLSTIYVIVVIWMVANKNYIAEFFRGLRK